MPKQVSQLTSAKIKAAKPTNKDYSLFDGHGLYLFIPKKKESGKISKLWRFKYTFKGKACLISLGQYPQVTLLEARQRRDEAKRKIAHDINPSQERKEKKQARQLKDQREQNTFEHIAERWFKVAKHEWSSGHARTITGRLNRDILPMLGKMPIHEITTKDILETLRLVEARAAYESAHRLNTIIGQVYAFALVENIPGVLNDPSQGLSKALKRPVKQKMPAITDPETLGRLLNDIDAYAGSHVVRCALRLAPMLYVRSGELRNMKWQDIDFDNATWNLPFEDMKLTKLEKAERKGQAHYVPLSSQSISILKELQPFIGDGKFVFPGRSSSRIISENTLNHALRNLGWDKETVVIHGFRATARTLLHEVLNFSPDAIEAQLGHKVPDRLGDAYNRTKHLPERVKMMQAWSDYLDKLKNVKI